MKSLERYGSPILSYEGSCQGVFSENDYRMEYSGYFEAAQYTSGRLVIGIVPTSLLPKSGVENQSNSDPKLTFAGTSTDGWEIKTIEETIFTRTIWSMAPMFVQPIELLISAPRFEASYRNRSEGLHYGVRFLISNFLWHDNERSGPEPIEFSVRGFRTVIDPVEDYRAVADQLTGGGGVQPTAQVYIECAGGPRLPLDKYAEFLDDLLFVLRIVTGNEVSWYYGEALDPFGQTVARIHNHSSPMPHSNKVRFRHIDKFAVSLIPKLDIYELIKAFFDETYCNLDKAILKKLVNQFTNATNTTPYLESSAMLASTLTEMIASTFASVRGKSNRITRDVYRNNVRPMLEDAIGNTGLPEEIRQHLRQSLAGVRRRTFGDKIRLLCRELRIPYSEDDIKRIVGIRNELVHRGTFLPASNGSNPVSDFNFMIWTDLILLCRLMGYGGNFTKQLNPDRIEV